ncbi:hypothetical protein B0H65DRAFT_540097 [Neurospora tetraspora]|uniref:Kelch repeat protein n=1 Tax=Neurospora tetraspora TaxID=94610 RepID=A0AAE0MQV5_9PEZI|nr:hypothetical protein B0H65DRAFT_540097 [Neurospora tetraspora]
MGRTLRSYQIWKLLPQFSCHAGLTLLLWILQTVLAELVDNPPESQFLRRSLTRGNQVSQAVSLHYVFWSRVTYPTLPNNSTLSIDISKSWSAKTVTIKATPKEGGPVPTDDEALWTDPSGEAFYVFGGRAPRGVGRERLAKDGIWKFTVDGAGGGTWALEEPSNLNMLKSLTLMNRAAYATSHTSSGSIGFSIGGTANNNTDPDFHLTGAQFKPIAGMVSYDMKTKTLSKSGFQMAIPPTGTLRDARAEYVPHFGPNGLVFVLGGVTYNAEPVPLLDHMLDMTNITFLTQELASGYGRQRAEMPQEAGNRFVWWASPARLGRMSCNDFVDTISYDDFYILTLPGFAWFQVPDRTPEPRGETSCAVIGNRQMIIVDGHDFAQRQGGLSRSWKIQDTFPQGLGLFDMVDLTFVQNFSYNAHAEAYRTPKVIEDWYRRNATNLSSAVPWSSDEVRDMFLARAATPVSFGDDEPESASTSSSSSSSSTASATPASTTKDKESSSTSNSNVGAIAGGIAGGGVVVLAIIAGLAYYFRFKRRRSKKPPPSPPGEVQPTLETGEPKVAVTAEDVSKPKAKEEELPTEPHATELYVPPKELANNHEVWELDAAGRTGELDTCTSNPACGQFQATNPVVL